MADCCDPGPYRSLFDEGEARRRLRDYRRRGLDETATEMVGYLVNRGVDGRSVLEVGGGIGDLQVELLRAGAARSLNVELSDGYEDVARELMSAEGMTDRVERRLGDFVEESRSIDPADIVVLNRVICCYPHAEEMMSAVAASASWLVGLALPRDRWLSRGFVTVANAFNRVRSCEFRAFVHSVSDIEENARRNGFEPVFSSQRLVWQALVFERVAG